LLDILVCILVGLVCELFFWEEIFGPDRNAVELACVDITNDMLALVHHVSSRICCKLDWVEYLLASEVGELLVALVINNNALSALLGWLLKFYG